jgi:hypothetical protein
VPAVLLGWSFPDTEEVTGSDLSRQPVVFPAWDATLATLPLPASMMRRPRPPPLTRKTPRPLTPTRCTETPAKAPAPDSLKLPPPYLAKLRQLNDQRTRQRPGAANRPPTDPALPPCCHRTPGSGRALVEVGRTVAGSGPWGTTCSAWGPTPAVVAGAPGRGAARGHRATTAATSTAAPTRFAARKTTPNRRYHDGLGTSTTALPPLLRPSVHQCNRLAPPAWR